MSSGFIPDLTGLDPVRECEGNIETVQRLIGVARRLAGDNALSAAVAAQVVGIAYNPNKVPKPAID